MSVHHFCVIKAGGRTVWRAGGKGNEHLGWGQLGLTASYLKSCSSLLGLWQLTGPSHGQRVTWCMAFCHDHTVIPIHSVMMHWAVHAAPAPDT